MNRDEGSAPQLVKVKRNADYYSALRAFLESRVYGGEGETRAPSKHRRRSSSSASDESRCGLMGRRGGELELNTKKRERKRECRGNV